MKAAEGALDFVDLLLRARDLLRDDAEVRRTFRERLSHLFVDEFQDTDPLQAEIVVLLAGSPDADRVSPVDWRHVQPRPGALFIVGDPKQSIYRFRRAESAPTGSCATGSGTRREAGDSHDQLSCDAGHPAFRERGICAADDRRCRDAQPPYVRLTPSRDDTSASPRWWRCLFRAPTARETSLRARLRSPFPMPSGRF